jgi:alkaline phosphatase D
MLQVLAATATASFAENLNYRSPSHHHPGLGVSIRKVAARNEPSTTWELAKLNFAHRVASSDPYDKSVILWIRAAPSADNDKSDITIFGYFHSTATRQTNMWMLAKLPSV